MSEAEFKPNWFSRPGDTLINLMARKSISGKDLAGGLGCSLQKVHQLVSSTAEINDDIASGISDIVGGTKEFWLNRQREYEISLRRVADGIDEQKFALWLKSMPHDQLQKNGWLPDDKSDRKKAESYLAFFGVNTPDEWEKQYAEFNSTFDFKTTSAYETRLGSLSAWLRRGEIVAATMPTASWRRERVEAILPELRRLTWSKKPTDFGQQIQEICASAGIAVVFLPAPAGCRASGAARRLSSEKALIIISFRYRTNDHFWFTLFHEIGHLMLHGDETFVDGGEKETSRREKEANGFAESILVPPGYREELLNLTAARRPITRFARKIGLAPGIVVGQMQHYRVISRQQMNFLKRSYSIESLKPLFFNL